MSALQWLGVGMVSLPYVGMFVFAARDLGVRIALAIFGGVVIIAAVMLTGTLLALGDLA